VFPFRQEYKTLRARWADLANEALREANVEARIDHRSLAAQGIDREPRPQLPWAAVVTERRGERSEVAEHIRERNRQRFAELREMRQRKAGKGAEQPADRPRADGSRIDTARDQTEERPEIAAPQGMDARRQQAVRDWLKFRASQQQVRRGQGQERSPPLSMDEIRQRAVAAWRALQARGAQGDAPAEKNPQERDAAGDRGDAGQARDTPGLGDDFSG
jgi:hypothetical protein